MKKLVTIFDINAIHQLKDYTDGFILGNNLVATRLTRSFDVEDIKAIAALAASYHKEVFLMMNRILHDKDNLNYETFIKAVDSEAITGYIIGDIGIAYIAKKLNLVHKMVYNPETLLANKFDVYYYQTLGFKGAYLAKEITKDDILEIGQDRPYHLFMYIHGYLNMFYSKRQLIESYFENQNKPHHYHEDRTLKVIEEKRPDNVYKALEDDGGTHIFRSAVFAGINHLEDLKNAVDYIVFDTIFHDDAYALAVLKYYETKDEAIKEKIFNDYQETWDEGFLFKKTVYKPKKVIL